MVFKNKIEEYVLGIQVNFLVLTSLIFSDYDGCMLMSQSSGKKAEQKSRRKSVRYLDKHTEHLIKHLDYNNSRTEKLQLHYCNTFLIHIKSYFFNKDTF